MDAQFWIDRWKEGSTAFHQDNFHDFLVKHFPKTGARRGQRTLVPLCGKTKDLLWLMRTGLKVHGYELYDKAVEAFFSENGLPEPQQTSNGAFTDYTLDNLVVSCGDFFQCQEQNTYDLVYDRAALVALPEPMRADYAKRVSRAMQKGGKQLLIAYTYDEKILQGPPFSVSESAIRKLYGADFEIRSLESRPGKEPKLATAGAIETVYLMERLS